MMFSNAALVFASMKSDGAVKTLDSLATSSSCASVTSHPVEKYGV